MGLHAKTLTDYLYLFKRRKYYILVTWLLVSLISVLVALSLPKNFRSTVTMLMEASLPTKLFDTTVTEFADERVQSLFQRVMTTKNVLMLIEKHGLYEDIKAKYPKQRLVDFFKSNTEMRLVASSIEPKMSSGLAEFAFDISFSDNEPEVAKDVVSSLAALFIEQNDKARTQRAIRATDFLLEESEKLNKELQAIENKIATFKEQHNFSLPEQAQSNLASIDRTESELRDTENQIHSTKERIAFLGAELARASESNLPDSPNSDGKEAQGKGNSLSALRAEYARLLSIYSQSHPSVARLKREIKMLDPSFAGIPGEEDVVYQITKSKKELLSLQKAYSDDHPEIVKLKNQISRLELQLTSSLPNTSSERKVQPIRTSNPAYLGLEAQYRTSQTDLQSLYQKQAHLKAKLDRINTVLTVAPQVEKDYNDMVRERDNTKNKYLQVKEKLLDAKMFQTQEQHQQGQMLTIIEEPVVPLQPEKGIRTKVAVGGFILGLLGGIGLALLVEFLDPRLIGYHAIAEATGFTPLVVIPYIETDAEEDEKLAKAKRRKMRLLLSILIILAMLMAAYFYFFMPSQN